MRISDWSSDVCSSDLRMGGILQERQVTGKITDTTGVPLPGVSISVRNHTNIGTSTDLNGRYVLDVPGPNAVLVFTLIGFETQEVPVGEQSTVNIHMKVSTSTLEDVVVVAFGVQIGRATCRGRVCQYVELVVVGVA